jgi:sterol desaturase/sphingolipid hydroxylase (fatty acid hydroxylase superfamily)
MSLGALLLVYYTFGLADLAWFYFGLILGLFSYEFMHYAAHHLNINVYPFKFMKQYHLAHHFKSPKKKFMVSCPVLDYLFKSN